MANTGVAAVVVNWNGRDLLGPCLDSILASSWPDLSVIVVDNGSTDGSCELVRERYPGVTLLENRANLGYAAGANTGLSHARAAGAEYALLLNNDVEIAADAIAALTEEARRRPRAALLGPMIYYQDEPDVIWSAGGAVSYWTGAIRHLGIRERDTGQHATVRAVDYVTGCAVLVSLSAAEEIGPLDVSYFMYNEDTDWCVRAELAGYEVLFVPAARIWHSVSMSSGGGLTPFKTYNRFRSTFRFFKRYAKPYHWLGIAPATACRILLFAGRELSRGRGANVAAVGRGLLHSITGQRRTA